MSADKLQGHGRLHAGADEIVVALAKTDPVYVTQWIRQSSFVRKCALCRATSGHNEENVLHEVTCPWIQVKGLVRGERQP